MSRGWVKIHREMSSHWVWDCEFSTGQAWVDLLMSACHKPNKLQIKGQIIDLKIGELARSEVTLARDWKWSRNKVRRFLKNLENDGMIEQKKGHLTSVITICNYSNFQANDTTDGTANDTTGGAAKGHLAEHKQECLRNKELNNKDISPVGESAIKKPKSKKVEFDESKVVDVWNSLGCIKHTMITKASRGAIEKSYKEYLSDCKKSDKEPQEPTDWIVNYLQKGFANWMTDHHRQLNDGQWAADLEFAMRPATYEKVKSTIVTNRTQTGLAVVHNDNQPMAQQAGVKLSPSEKFRQRLKAQGREVKF